jgi:hypothetical protein
MRLFLFHMLFCCTVVIGQNINISQGLIFEGEPFIAQNPTNSNHLVVAWMGFKLGEKVVIKTKSSFDGGLSWTSWTSLPHLIIGHTSADPSLDFDSDGNVFVCYIDYDNVDKLTGSVVVAKSVDGGETWSSPVMAIDMTMCPDKLCIDRPWMAIDRSTGLLNGSIYVTSMNADEPEVLPPYNPIVAASIDGGLSFDLFRQLDTVDYLAGSLIRQPMPSPAVAADGRFFAMYPSFMLSQSVFARNILASSTNGAVSLMHSVVNNVTQGFSESDTKKAPLLIAHPSEPNRLAYIYLSESLGDLDVFMIESLDGGVSWSAPLRVNDDPTNNGVLQDMLWADYNSAGDILVCWRDRRNGGQGFAVPTEIFAAVKQNSASVFSTNFVITDQLVPHDPILASPGNDFLSVALTGDTAHIVWGDIRSGVLNIYYSRTSISNPVANIQTITSADWRFKNVYPNPGADRIYMDDQYIGADFMIISGNSGVVMDGIITEAGLDVSRLASGEYYIIVKLLHKDIGLKFIKN